MNPIDLAAVRQQRQNLPIARTATAFLNVVEQTNRAGIDNETVLRGMTYALAKAIVMMAQPGEAESIGQQISKTLPDMVDFFEKRKLAGPENGAQD